MNRVVTIASSGLIAAGLAIMPIAAFAQGNAAGGTTSGSAPAASSTMAPGAGGSVATTKPAPDAKASTATAAAKPAAPAGGVTKEMPKDGAKVTGGGTIGAAGGAVAGATTGTGAKPAVKSGG